MRVALAVAATTSMTTPPADSVAESTARIRAILDTAVEAIVTIDETGVCESFNPAAERIFGYTADEVIGRNVSLLMPSPYREEHDGYIANYLRTGDKRIIGIGREAVGLRKDGTEFPIHLSVSEVQLGDRRLFTGMIQDLTESKDAERRLVQSERLAAVGAAVSRLAHESRNLLQKIQMAVEFGRHAGDANRELGEQLDTIERACEGLQALLDEVRSYAAPIQLERSEESLPDLWQEAWQSLERERRDRQADIRQEIETASPRCSLDRFRIVQVFRNLLENSLAACADPVEVSIGMTESRDANSKVLRIVLRDNGPGLSSEQRQRVFEPFYTTKSKGTGLGMAIAQRIIEAHGGRIAVADTSGDGAEFVIELPR